MGAMAPDQRLQTSFFYAEKVTKMKQIVIVGGTREAARERLRIETNGSKIRRFEGYDEATLDGCRYLAMGGEDDEATCWLVGLGFHIEKIITVEPDGISEEMGKRINHVRSTLEWQRRQQCAGRD